MANPRGVRIETADHREAHRLRRQLYAEREKHRARGENKYDGLSFIVKPIGDLLIFPRAAILSEHRPDFEFPVTPLTEDELPARIRSRGKSKVGCLYRETLSSECDLQEKKYCDMMS